MLGGDEKEHEGEMGLWVWQHQNLFCLKVLGGTWTLADTFVNCWSNYVGVKENKNKGKKRAENTLRLYSREIRAVKQLLQKGRPSENGTKQGPDPLGPRAKFSSMHAAAP